MNQPLKLYNEYRIFDRIAIEEEAHVAIKFLRNQEAPIFYYYRTYALTKNIIYVF